MKYYLLLVYAFLATFTICSDICIGRNNPIEFYLSILVSDIRNLYTAGYVQYKLLSSSNRLVDGNFTNVKGNINPIEVILNYTHRNLYVANGRYSESGSIDIITTLNKTSLSK